MTSNSKPDHRSGDEAGIIRRGLASGDDIHHGSSKASIEGGFWLGLLAVLASLGATAAAWYSLGAVNGAVYQAQMAERNAKLAQYQLEETLKRNNLEVPHE